MEFRWSSAVQTTCPACKSILVRHDLDLTRVGQVGDVPPIMSAIQLGTEGRYKGVPFVVVGRIIYGHERGYWNEWHVRLDDDTSAWLSDAQAEYAVTRQVQPEVALPAASALRVGQRLRLADSAFEVASITVARYLGVEGELPFEYWDKGEVLFADLKSATDRFATIDYTEEPPLLFVGEYEEFDELQFGNLVELDESWSSAGAGAARAKALNCLQCGAAIELRAGTLTRVVACSACATVLDASHDGLRILHANQQRQRWTPLIPLGQRGRFRGEPWQAIGFQVRSIRVEDVEYEWREYVLWNPHRGFRYLTEYDGHWNDVLTTREMPWEVSGGTQPVVSYHGLQFKHFQSARARTRFILGEFPWEVRVGDAAEVHDYVSPPFALSREEAAGEVTWSLGTYTSPDVIWKAFKLPGTPPSERGVYANQPNDWARTARDYVRLFAFFAVAIVLLTVGRMATARNERVFQQSYIYNTRSGDTGAFVTPTFALAGRPSNVEIQINTDLENDWAFFDLALIEARSGKAWELGREVSYYYGWDEGERWTEGSRRDRAILAAIPAGTYYLRVEPERDPGRPGMTYSVAVRRDVPRYWPSAVALLLLALPFALALLAHYSFETQRWAESDHAPVTSDDDD